SCAGLSVWRAEQRPATEPTTQANGAVLSLGAALHGLDERSQRRRDLAATRIVEVKPWEARAPILEHGFERTVGQMGGHLRLEGEANHLAGQHRELGDARVVLEQRSGHRDLALAASLRQFPPIRFPA